MKKPFRKMVVGVLLSVIFASVGIGALAATLLFFTQHESTEFEKKTIFRSVMSLSSANTQVGPGDSVSFMPCVYNDGTEKMYVFLKVKMPVAENDYLYEFTVSDGWIEVESGEGYVVYAYVDADSQMCELDIAETTPSLTSQITMKNISNASYAAIDDINISVDSYVIGVGDASTDPDEAWLQCQQAGAGS